MKAAGALSLALAAALALLLWTALRDLGPAILWFSTWVLWWPFRRQRFGRSIRYSLWLLLAFWILRQARWVVYPLVSGVLLSYVLSPVVDSLVARRVRRPLACVLALLPIVLIAVLALLLLVPALIQQIALLVERLPAAYEYVRDWVGSWGPRVGLPPITTAPADSLAGPAGAVADSLGRAAPGPSMPSWVQQLVAHAEAVLSGAMTGISGVSKGVGRALQWLGVLVLTPIVAFYFLLDWSAIGAGALEWLPPRWRTLMRRLSRELQDALTIFLRGQAIVAGIEFVLFLVAFRLAGLSQALVLAFLAALFSLVPILGFAITITLVVLTAVTGPDPGSTLLRAGIGLAVINVLENQVLVPRVQGSGLRLHPLIVLFGVLLSGTLFGVVGIFLAVPLLAVLRGFVPDLREMYRNSRLYDRRGPQTIGNPPPADEGDSG